MDYQIKITEVKEVLRFVSGKVKLTVEQAATRMHNLLPEGDGIFTVVKPIEFKVGETVGIVSAYIPEVEIAETAEEIKIIPVISKEIPKKKDKEKAVKAGKKIIDPTI